jgi:hypothetical protein
MKKPLIVLALAALVLFSGCTSPSSTGPVALDRPVVTAMSPNEVIEIARACYLAHGAKIVPGAEYVLAYQVLPTKRQWTVHFGGQHPRIDYAWVVIDESTRKADFFPEP